MQTIEDLNRIRSLTRKWSKDQKTIGFVPTMGALHDGHLSLVRQSVRECTVTVASVFVNPIQFGPGEDFERYPRDLDGDSAALADAGVDVLFAPTAENLFAPQFQTRVHPGPLAEELCGDRRPGHFEGVTTIVTKLFHLVQPDRAYFGQKDYQQARVLMQMVEDLNFDLSLRIVPTVREEDGLAMSSRNALLTAAERPQAPSLYAALCRVRDEYDRGERDAGRLLQAGREALRAADQFRLDYFEVRDDATLKPASTVGDAAVAALAAQASQTRLIDNILLGDSNRRLIEI